MKMLIGLTTIAGLAGTAIGALADEVQLFRPVAPYAIEVHQGTVAERHGISFEQADALQRAMKAQRELVERQAEALRQAEEPRDRTADEPSPGTAGMPRAPRVPKLRAPWESPPRRGDGVGLDTQRGGGEMRGHFERVRRAVREQREQLRRRTEQQHRPFEAEHAGFLGQIDRRRPEV